MSVVYCGTRDRRIDTDFVDGCPVDNDTAGGCFFSAVNKPPAILRSQEIAARLEAFANRHGTSWEAQELCLTAATEIRNLRSAGASMVKMGMRKYSAVSERG